MAHHAGPVQISSAAGFTLPHAVGVGFAPLVVSQNPYLPTFGTQCGKGLINF